MSESDSGVFLLGIGQGKVISIAKIDCMAAIPHSDFNNEKNLRRHPCWKARQKDRILQFVINYSEELVPIFSYQVQRKLGLSEEEIWKLVNELEEELQVLVVNRPLDELGGQFMTHMDRMMMRMMAFERCVTVRPKETRYTDLELLDEEWK